MKSSIQFNSNAKRVPTSHAVILARLGLSSVAQAVNAPPDGGYPNGNTAEGSGALRRLISGTYNAAVGLFSIYNNFTGNSRVTVANGSLAQTKTFGNFAPRFPKTNGERK